MSHTIDDRFVGVDWMLVFTVTDVPETVDITDAIFILKTGYTIDDDAAVISVAITTNITANGVIEEGTPSGGFKDYTLTFLVPETSTSFDNIEPRRKYYYRVPIATTDQVTPFSDVAVDGVFIPQ